jgi:hypothetical protein
VDLFQHYRFSPSVLLIATAIEVVPHSRDRDGTSHQIKMVDLAVDFGMINADNIEQVRRSQRGGLSSSVYFRILSQLFRVA